MSYLLTRNSGGVIVLGTEVTIEAAKERALATSIKEQYPVEVWQPIGRSVPTAGSEWEEASNAD